MSSNGLEVQMKGITTISSDVESAKVYPKEFSYEEALRLIGFGRVQLEVLFVCGIILMTVINETMGMGLIAIASQCDFNTTSQEKGIMNAACFCGILLASYPWGYVSDTSGRRIVMLWSMISAIAISFVSMFVTNLWVYVVLRFLTGVGISGAASAIYAYLGEFNTLKYRPVVINYASIFVGVSSVYSPALAWLILPQTWSISIFGVLLFRPWRLLMLFNILPGLIGALWIWALPETPKLYLSHGKNDEALKVVHWIYEKNTGKPAKDFQVKRLMSEENKEFMEMLSLKKSAWEMTVSMWNQAMPLFKPPHVLNYMVCCVVMYGMFLTSTGMGLWYPEIQNRLGFGGSDAQKTICQVIDYVPNGTLSLEETALEAICTDVLTTKMYIDSIMLGASYIVAYTILGVVINPLGRKAILAGSLALSGLCGLALQWIVEPTAIVILFCGFLMLPGLSISVLSGCVVELIPTHLRGKAMCICLMIGRLGSVSGSNIIGAILEMYCGITFYTFSGFMVLCSLLTLILPI